MDVLFRRQFDHPRDRSKHCEMCVKLFNKGELRGQRSPIRQDQFEIFHLCEDCEEGCGGNLGMFLCGSCFESYEAVSSEHSLSRP